MYNRFRTPPGQRTSLPRPEGETIGQWVGVAFIVLALVCGFFA